MVNRGIVYKLIDPRDGMPRYVGFTRQRLLCMRMSRHGYEAKISNKPVSRWVAELKRLSLKPLVEVLNSKGTAKDEIYWINFYRALGFPLLNAHENCGKHYRDPNLKARISKALLGKRKSESHRLKLEKKARDESPLTIPDVKKIRRLYASGRLFQREIGEMFGINQTSISQIVLRKTWRNV